MDAIYFTFNWTGNVLDIRRTGDIQDLDVCDSSADLALAKQCYESDTNVITNTEGGEKARRDKRENTPVDGKVKAEKNDELKKVHIVETSGGEYSVTVSLAEKFIFMLHFVLHLLVYDQILAKIPRRAVLFIFS